ncbi:hypothetical protein K0T92_19585 [Paenibacillus oenotherae]|uniref:Lipoprotein n=1 Tax=Paenibacillus oenotherae TaxID=1435645 RepID=A0ABS7DAF8_9BACL|nr:hypothetical protein [Paenibacillus oenotherae]MBW7476924.1 hypothetical protein [Paenibacillus oenotherae]
MRKWGLTAFLLLTAGILLLAGCSNETETTPAAKADNVADGSGNEQNKTAGMPAKGQDEAAGQPDKDKTVGQSDNGQDKAVDQPAKVADKAVSQPAIGEVAPAAPAFDVPSDVLDKVTEEMKGFIALIRDKKIEPLLQKTIALNAEYGPELHDIGKDGIERALAGLEYEIDLDSIEARLANVSSSHESGMYQLGFSIHGTKDGKAAAFTDLEDMIHMTYIAAAPLTSSSSITLNWNYFRYFPYNAGLLNAYINAIKARDTAKIADVMTVDDLIYTEAKAKKIIAMYDLFFDRDLDSLSVAYNGDWEYVIQDAHNNAHKVAIIFGDGLMGIVDEFAPSAYN